MKTKAQSILEYVVLIGIISIALSVMQIYFRRGVSAVVKVAADEVGSQKDAEEIDPAKGTKTNSKVRRVSSGALQASTELAQGVSQRQRRNSDGSTRTDLYTVSSTEPYCDDNGCTNESYSTFISRK